MLNFWNSYLFQMSGVFGRYFINFWLWWYFVRGRLLLETLLGVWNFTLGYFNVVPMLTNLFVPLYQDYTSIGRLVSIPIRLIWVLVGTFLQLIVTIPLISVFLAFVLLPLIPVLGILNFVFNLL